MTVKDYRDFSSFDESEARSFLDQIRAQKKEKANSRFHYSRLDPHKATIFKLQHLGYKPAEIFKYCRQKLRLSIRSLSTLTRWLEKHHDEYIKTFSDD